MGSRVVIGRANDGSGSGLALSYDGIHPTEMDLVKVMFVFMIIGTNNR